MVSYQFPPPLYFSNMGAQQSLRGVPLLRLAFMSPPPSTGASRKGLACLVDDSIGVCVETEKVSLITSQANSIFVEPISFYDPF